MEAVRFYLIYAYIIELVILGITFYNLRITKQRFTNSEMQRLTLLSIGWVFTAFITQLFNTEENNIYLFFIQAFFWMQFAYHVMLIATGIAKKQIFHFWKFWKNLGLVILLVSFLLHLFEPFLMTSIFGPDSLITSSNILIFLFLLLPASHTFYFLFAQNEKNKDQTHKQLLNRTLASYFSVIFFGLFLDCVIPSFHHIHKLGLLSFTSIFIGFLIVLFFFNFKSFFLGAKNIKYVFHHLIYNLNDGIIFIDEKGKIVLANESAHTILGVSNNQLIYKQIQTIIPNINPFLETQRFPVFLDNSKQVLSFNLSIIKNEFPEDEFEYLLILTNTKEVNQLKKQLEEMQVVFNEEKLDQQLMLNDVKKIIQEKETYLRTLIDHLPFRLWSKNEIGVYSLQNQIDVNYTGYKIGQSVEKKTSEEIRAENGDTVDFDTSEIDSEGNIHYFHNLFIPLFSSTGRSGVIGISEDITEKKHLEKERDQLRERVFISNKIEDLGNLAGGIAHDFNNILGAQIGFCELALENMSENSSIKSFIDEVLKASMRGKKTVQKLLGSVQNTKQEAPSKFIAGFIIEEVIKLIKVTLPPNINIVLSLNDDKAAIEGYPEEFHRILLNLSTNAISAMKNKGGTLSLETQKKELKHEVPLDYTTPIPPSSYLTIKVSDTGDGIPPNVLQRIFSPFFTTKGPKEGLGLGLSTTLLLLKEAKAYITVETIVGKGSTFTIYWPYSTLKKEEP